MSKNIKIFLLVFVGFAIISNVIAFINGTGWFKSESTTTKQKDLKDGKEIIRYDKGIEEDWSKSFLVEGEFYQDDSRSEREVTLKLNNDNTYSFVFYNSGELVENKKGVWRTEVLSEKKIKDPRSRKILVLDNKYLFDYAWVPLFDELCLRSYDEIPFTNRLVESNIDKIDYDILSPLGEFIIGNASTTMLCKKYDRTRQTTN